jgi:hypothetical protein
MEKKDWRGDLLKIGDRPDGSEETVFVEFHLDTLNDFIKKVVDKAREEGRKEGLVENLDKRNSEGGLTILESLIFDNKQYGERNKTEFTI